jgi:GNAT superfamily N-acetyltransferase
MVERLWLPFATELAEGSTFDPPDEATVPTAVAAREDRLDSDCAATFVAESGPLQGFVGGECVELSAGGGRTELAIDELYVRPEYRGNAVASRLLSAIENWGRRHDCGTARVAVHSSEEAARSVFREAGYREHRSGMTT